MVIKSLLITLVCLAFLYEKCSGTFYMGDTPPPSRRMGGGGVGVGGGVGGGCKDRHII